MLYSNPSAVPCRTEITTMFSLGAAKPPVVARKDSPSLG